MLLCCAIILNKVGYLLSDSNYESLRLLCFVNENGKYRSYYFEDKRLHIQKKHANINSVPTGRYRIWLLIGGGLQ
ncbi:hypothetical protein ASG61_27835 [Bacillus sp. Leaf75]|nr:hypothetical protein ASG61_27835 [Bacillus sp. Leaf75]